jgi:hypothetical protein
LLEVLLEVPSAVEAVGCEVPILAAAFALNVIGSRRLSNSSNLPYYRLFSNIYFYCPSLIDLNCANSFI